MLGCPATLSTKVSLPLMNDFLELERELEIAESGAEKRLVCPTMCDKVASYRSLSGRGVAIALFGRSGQIPF
jgi:hypothetical protein